MSTNKVAFGTSTSITVSLNSLAHAAARSSAVIDNGTNLYFDAMITVITKLSTGTPGSDKVVNVYVYASEDGTNYISASGSVDDVDGTDKTLTALASPTNMRFIGSISTPTSGALSYKGVFNVAHIFGGILPRKWGLVIENRTNLAFDSFGCSASYSGIYTTAT